MSETFSWFQYAYRLSTLPTASAIGAPKEKIRIEPIESPVPKDTPASPGVESPADTPVPAETEKDPVGA